MMGTVCCKVGADSEGGGGGGGLGMGIRDRADKVAGWTGGYFTSDWVWDVRTGLRGSRCLKLRYLASRMCE